LREEEEEDLKASILGVTLDVTPFIFFQTTPPHHRRHHLLHTLTTLLPHLPISLSFIEKKNKKTQEKYRENLKKKRKKVPNL
jgi:hypothetical protein